ncbi:unnamed protein product [Aspergillus oryzae RIB40]|uniref:DNA, SC003 n=1 Tax=Aspergillus oryzae (strain ATCC 42149 / RIB 40) TaxID=510516 RepID=Q2ULD6_ASPOR|nr:unnamed protein product [Aspergillus oryzae RIB40]BAE57629.1 unnamed protein product [Aspergillus oryzae RIB40]
MSHTKYALWINESVGFMSGFWSYTKEKARKQEKIHKMDGNLGLALGLLQDGLHLGRLHNVTLDLELASHEESLGVGLAADQGSEVRVGEGQSHCLSPTRYG